MPHFGDSLIQETYKKNSVLVVGLDPIVEFFPKFLWNGKKTKDLTLQDRCNAIYTFNTLVIDAISDHAVAVKPQLAYFELYGSKGIEVLEQTIAYAKSKNLLVINDGKRGDIDSTATAYASAYLRHSPLAGDAITVNPFMGSDGIHPFIQAANEEQRGLFLLLKTSNPSSEEIQNLTLIDQCLLYEQLAKNFSTLATHTEGTSGYSFIGAVVGATYPEQARNLRKQLKNMIFLVPGFGKQGADAQNLRHFFNEDGNGAIISSSRAILYSYVDNRKDWEWLSIEEMRKIIQNNAEQSRHVINSIRV